MLRQRLIHFILHSSSRKNNLHDTFTVVHIHKTTEEVKFTTDL